MILGHAMQWGIHTPAEDAVRPFRAVHAFGVMIVGAELDRRLGQGRREQQIVLPPYN